MKRISKNTIRRAVRTFFQAFLGAFITAGTGIMWDEVNIVNAMLGILLTSTFAGLSALCMNLESKKEDDDYE